MRMPACMHARRCASAKSRPSATLAPDALYAPDVQYNVEDPAAGSSGAPVPSATLFVSKSEAASHRTAAAMCRVRTNRALTDFHRLF